MSERLVSETGMPKAKRGRGAGKSVSEKAAEYGMDVEADVEFLMDNLGQAVGYKDFPANLGYQISKEFGVDVGARRIKKGIAEEVWFEWPSYEDETGNVVEDIDAVEANRDR